MDRIFVQIAGYRDPQCGPTIRDLLSKAQHPERLRFGICLQWNSDNPEEEILCGPSSLPDEPLITVDAVNAQASRGTCWARARCQQLWRGEEFTLQIDSHMRAEQHWDSSLLACWQKTGNTKAIISCYPNAFSLDELGEACHYKRAMLPIMGAKEFDSNGILRLHGISQFAIPDQLPEAPPPSAFISAGMLFGPANLIEAAPYDPDLYFYGEETTYAARLWTAGFDLYSPDRLLLYHLYKTTGHAMPTHWADHSDWNALDRASIARATGLLRGQLDLAQHGLGSARSLADYQEWAGVDFTKKTIRPHAIKGQFGDQAQTSRYTGTTGTA